MSASVESETGRPAWSVAKGPAHWPTLLIVCIGFAISCCVLWMLRTSELTRASDAFEAAAREHQLVVNRQVTDIVDSLQAVSALFRSSDNVTRQEFGSFTRTIIESHPEILAVVWIPKVTAQERAQFERDAAAETASSFAIRQFDADGRRVAAPARAEFFPTLYIEPFSTNRRALGLGLDHSALPLRFRAMQAASAAGAPIASGGFKVFRPAGSPSDAYDIAIFSPHYAANSDVSSAASRNAALGGFVGVMFTMNAVLDTRSVASTGRGIALELRVGSPASAPVIRSGDIASVANPALRHASTLELPGLRFFVTSYATPEFAAGPRFAPSWIAFLAGLAITLLVAWHFRSLRGRLWAHQQLRTERDRLFLLSPDLLCVCGFDGMFRELGREWERTLGYTRAELLSRQFFDFVHPDDLAATRERLDDLRAGSNVIDFINRYRCRDGSYRSLQWRCAPVAEQALIYGVARDISQQLEIDRELREVRRFNDRIADVVPCVLYIYDYALQRTVYVNLHGSSMVGWPRENFQSQPDVDGTMLMHPDDLLRLRDQLERIKKLGSGEVIDFTYRIRRDTGEWRWFQSRDTVFERDAQGVVQKSIGAATDITEIKIAEEALRENSRRLDFVLAAANIGVWEVNLETGATVWTESYARVLGLSVEQAPLRFEDFLQFVHPDDRDKVRRRFEEAFANGSAYEAEFRLASTDGKTRWIGEIGKFLCDDAGRPQRLFGLGWDATARKSAEEQRVRFEEQLRQSQKMEALGTLAGGIAHDFNNILTAVSGNTRLALQELPPIHPVRTSLEEIQRGAARATDLVRRILAFSRDEESVLRPVDLQVVVEDATRLLRPIVPAMIDIKLDAAPDLPAVLADATQIHQVIMNLGTNARDAMGESGGVLTIQLSRARLDARLKTLAPDLEADTCVCISVSDTGPGIAPQVLERIFEPFFTTKGPGRGTGMGLAMVHGIVRKHGGVILASSQPGRGARFDSYLPALATQAQAPTPTETSPRVTGNGERIMYVDDEDALVYLAIRMLTKLGYVAEGRTDAALALRELKSDPHAFDMVVTDLGMPGMSGIEFAAQLRSIRHDLPIVITSGFVRPEDLARARAIGIDEIVLKPNTVEEMAHVFANRLRDARHVISTDSA